MTRLAPRFALASLLLCSSLVAVSGCRSDVGTHNLAVEGSEAVTAGLTTSDGWTVEFSSLVVVIHHPGLVERTNDKPAWVREFGVSVWDVVQPTADDDRIRQDIRASSYDGAEFRIAPASESKYEAFAGNVADSVVDAAVDDDWAYRVVGTATSGDGSQVLAFDWTFTSSRRYRCKFDGDEVVELGADGDETTVIEILGEALFAGEGGAVFDPFAAADQDGDGEITRAELDAAGLLDALDAAGIGGIRNAGACPVIDAETE
jgi:hypothetical protein